MKPLVAAASLAAAAVSGYFVADLRSPSAAGSSVPDSNVVNSPLGQDVHVASAAPVVSAMERTSAAREAPPRPDFAELLAEVPMGEDDPLAIPMETGIVWYGTWEDAIAEMERTGKPVMLHFGSPRCPGEGVCVPGTW